MPYAMRGSGSAGLLSVLLCCFLFCTTGKFIHWGLDMIPDSAPRDYPGLGEASLGLLGRRLVSIAAAAELFGAACMSLLIMWRSTEVCYAPILHNPLTRARITARAPAHRLSQGQHGSSHSGPGQAQALTGLCKRPSDGSNRKVSWRWVSTHCNTAEHAPVPPRCISHVPLAPVCCVLYAFVASSVERCVATCARHMHVTHDGRGASYLSRAGLVHNRPCPRCRPVYLARPRHSAVSDLLSGGTADA